ncbi:NYN domain-containing protein [Myroides marinus]|uniref:hypothetical protein n=1 Tax=Myroides marinus TaxID=703342 RepID=UPI002576EB5C|nr:hypothetical protein [Myroides marinus]MDM1352173.1 NYN domain-containing protein [Myroides marinus]MDM1359388.1 NYN domain-containing protein [Myroides marinus]MDM1366503.1 NYN domain-containing protein [Myroides marinus]
MSKNINISNVDKKYGGVSILLFVLYPLLSIFVFIKNTKSKVFSNLLWLLSGYFGYTMYVNDPIYDPYRYKYFFLDSLSFRGDFFEFINYRAIQGDLDVYLAIVSYFSAIFSKDYHFFFCVLGLIFGYFYSRNVHLVLRYTNNVSGQVIIYIGAILVLKSFWFLFGARFWTAAHIFILIVLIYFLKRKLNYWLICILPIVHVSMLLPLLVFVSYIVIIHKFKLQKTYLLVIFILSILMSGLIGDLAIKMVGFLPPEIGGRLDFYNSSEYRSFKDGNKLSIFSIVFIWCGKFYFLLSTFIIYRNWKVISTLKYSYFALFLLYFAAIASLISSIPILDRFWHIVFFLLVIFNLIVFTNLKDFKHKFLFNSLTILLLLVCIQNIYEYHVFFGRNFFLPLIFNLFD